MESVESRVRTDFEALNRCDLEAVVARFAEDDSFTPDEGARATRTRGRGVMEAPTW